MSSLIIISVHKHHFAELSNPFLVFLQHTINQKKSKKIKKNQKTKPLDATTFNIITLSVFVYLLSF